MAKCKNCKKEIQNGFKYCSLECKEEHSKPLLKKIWEKTIFPDMIKHNKTKKKLMREIKREAEIEALIDLKDEMKENIKQKELNKLMGKKEPNKGLEFLQKGFAMKNTNIQEKILGKQNKKENNTTDNKFGYKMPNLSENNNKMFSEEKLRRMLRK